MHTKTKSKVLLGHTNDPREMLDSAVRLLKEAKLGPLRLIGVRMADFEKEREIESGQLRISDLLSSEQDKHLDDASGIVDERKRMEHEDWLLAQQIHQEEYAVLRLPEKKKLNSGKGNVRMNTIESLFNAARNN